MFWSEEIIILKFQYFKGISEKHKVRGASPIAQLVNNSPANAKNTRFCMKRRFNPWMGRSPGEGNGNPLQYSCLENSMDRAAWWATVHGVSKSQTRLSTHAHARGCARTRAHTHTHTHIKLGRNRNCIMTWVIWSHTLVVIWFEFAYNIANSLTCSWNPTR